MDFASQILGQFFGEVVMPGVRWWHSAICPICLVVITIAVRAAYADPYWIAYEGDDYPENRGWERTYGDGSTEPPHGEPNRWIEDGVLMADTTLNNQLWEYYSIHGQVNPGPGELFVAEWRVMLDLTAGPFDGTVVIARDSIPGRVGLTLLNGYLRITNEDVFIPITPGEFHEYRFQSWDMEEYELYVDGQLAHVGEFWTVTLLESFVAWGPGVQGASSMSSWDYFRFGVNPEPSALLLMLTAFACHGGRRR